MGLQSIPLNIAEGNGKGTADNRRLYFEIARGSALECAAIQDVLEVRKTLTSGQNQEGKALLDRIAAMLTRLGGRTFTVHEPDQVYRTEKFDTDTDTDNDSDNDNDVLLHD